MTFDYLVGTLSADKWKKIGLKKRAGILAPLFSIYSKNSIGIGDFSDLKLLIDWCISSKNSIIQLLPINEVGALFCPYDALSSFALEPSYFSFDSGGYFQDKKTLDKISQVKRNFPLNQGHVDYRIKDSKTNLLRDIFCSNNIELVAPDGFIADNSYWLDDFVLYKTLKNYYHGRAWYDWEDKFKFRDRQALQEFRKDNKKEINFQIWLQWQLYEQLKSAKQYAESKNVFLKGDLPILVSEDSADVWAHPEFFKLGFVAGAPPDMYCAKGQRWGMPTYDWQKIEQDNYQYLKEKLKFAQNFYHILRIDHVVGLFRIWSIPSNDPLENIGLNGFFDPIDECKWGEQGKKILSVMLANTNMLLCAEDLGVIPKVCIDTLKDFGIPGNDVQRWVKDWNNRHDFLKPEEYRAVSVAMLSTHDTTNWPAWWENEAGTVDEDLFIRKCIDHRKIEFNAIKDKIFDIAGSNHGRLRWRQSIDSEAKLISFINKREEEIRDFIDLYLNSFQEKEKLWKILRLPGSIREKSDHKILRAVLKMNFDSNAIFCINTIFDLLYLEGVLKGDPYEYRINTPGTVDNNNWSLLIPFSLEDLSRNKVTQVIKDLVLSSGRV